MYKPESFFDNKTYKLLCDFEIKTDHLISGRRSDLAIVYKKNPVE